MDKKYRIAFVWTNGIRNKDRFNRWNDGLRAALRLIEQKHTVTYHEPDEDIRDVDVILFWEAGITYQSAEWGHAYRKVQQNPIKKALLFAGGSIKYEYFKGFDLVFVESRINEEELSAIGIPWMRAFGVNTDVFKPLNVPKTHTTVTHGTSASWKRQWLVCKAMREEALVFGQRQEHDTRPFDECAECKSTVMGEASYEDTNKLLNSAHVSVNCADFWGGGQRATLEAMACDIPVVVMEDSPKNREYVEEAGIGLVVPPEPEHIKIAVEQLKGITGGRDYVMSKWTHHHYAENLLKGINQICQ